MHGLLESERAAVKQPFLMIDSSSRRVFSQQSCESTPTCILMLHKSSQVPQTQHIQPHCSYLLIFEGRPSYVCAFMMVFSLQAVRKYDHSWVFLSTFQQPLFQMNDSVARSWKRAANFRGTWTRHVPKCGWIIEKDVDVGANSDVNKC